MHKKTPWIILIIVLVLGFVVWDTFTREDGYEKYAPGSRDVRLADPDLLYASSSSSGLCRNEKGEEGGCGFSSYLYASGTLAEETTWSGVDGSETISPSERQVSEDVVNQITKELRDSGIMNKDCPEQLIMDAGWSYQVTMDGVTKSFDNPPQECQDIFDKADAIIDGESPS